MKTTKNITNNMKRAMFCFIFIPYSLSPCHAQLNEAHKKGVCNAYMRANYIFEGKIISSKYITIKTGERTYANFSSYLVQVNKVIKGNIQIGTIEIVAWAPGITYKGDDHTVGGLIYDGPAPPPDEGIYFTKVEEHRKDSNVANTKKLFKILLIKKTKGIKRG
jgi:hypothetical protein